MVAVCPTQRPPLHEPVVSAYLSGSAKVPSTMTTFPGRSVVTPKLLGALVEFHRANASLDLAQYQSRALLPRWT